MIEYGKKFFINYESVKLEILQTDYTNLIIVLFFSFLIMLTIKKEKFNKAGYGLLSLIHTEQLKGVAIFFVILGHLWVHVSKTQAKIILSGDSVSLFLILSGFGLTISTGNRITEFKDFFLKRIKRVMVPYWIVTIFIIALDYFILKKTLQIDSLLMTFLGINTSIELQHLDYVRWFVTFILFWYFLFFLFFLKCKITYSPLLLFIIAFALLPLNYYVFHFGWYQYFSFPTGCLLAVYYKKILLSYKENKSRLILLSIIGMTYVLTYKFFMSNENIYSAVAKTIPNIFLAYVSEGNALILSISFLVISGSIVGKGYYSNILGFLGKYSYELFLLHGIFLIKYNPFITGHGSLEIFMQFLIYFLFVTGLSMITYKIHTSINEI